MIQSVESKPGTDFDYDEFLKQVMQIPPRDTPSWIRCRSLEEAEAFAAWCVENEIEEPEIAIKT